MSPGSRQEPSRITPQFLCRWLRKSSAKTPCVAIARIHSGSNARTGTRHFWLSSTTLTLCFSGLRGYMPTPDCLIGAAARRIADWLDTRGAWYGTVDFYRVRRTTGRGGAAGIVVSLSARLGMLCLGLAAMPYNRSGDGMTWTLAGSPDWIPSGGTKALTPFLSSSGLVGVSTVTLSRRDILLVPGVTHKTRSIISYPEGGSRLSCPWSCVTSSSHVVPRSRSSTTCPFWLFCRLACSRVARHPKGAVGVHRSS